MVGAGDRLSETERDLSTLGWVLVGMGTTGYALTWRPLFRAMADDMVSDWADLVFLMFFSTLACCGWPLFALVRGFQRTVGQRDAEAFAKRLGGMSHEERQERKSLRDRERAIEIARQERELGIVSDAR